jgi:N-methylhydantoinase A
VRALEECSEVERLIDLDLQEAAAGKYRVGADIGGTFTDVVLAAADGWYWTKKVLSTPDDYARSVVRGLSLLLAELGLGPEVVQEIVHGTTVAGNAILENKGAKIGLVTTRGFRDVLELRRLRVPQLYNLAYKPPPPMVQRRHRLEVDERVGADGEVLVPLDEEGVVKALKRLKDDGVEALAVCFIHSYTNPSHEQRVGAMAAEIMPGLHVSLSTDVLPEIREYERTSTTVINAYVGPVVRTYLRSLTSQLQKAKISAPLLIMQSNGGVMSARTAGDKPAHIVESGPAAGVIGAQVMGLRAGLGNIISFDMGGTTAKASIIEKGQLSRTTEYEVGAGISLSSRLVKGGGHALKLPVLDLAEVGSGGGSIVWIDKGDLLRVGPQSAGANPGPACYDQGGKQATVTDANVVLGYLNPNELAGGTLKLRPDFAREALSKHVAHPLGMELLDAAYGVYSLVNANMIRAIKAVSTYRGRDPRDFALLAFGGSGPVHAVALATELGISTVVVPPAPGLFSAMGLLEAQTEHHFVRTFIRRTSDVELDALRATCTDLADRARHLLDEDGYRDRPIDFQWLADMRYVGQAYELSVSMEALPGSRTDIEELAELFGREHELTYGHRAHDEPVEFVNLRLIARVTKPKHQSLRARIEAKAFEGERLAYFGAQHGEMSAPVVSRSKVANSGRPGPLIIEDYDATTVVPPGASAKLDGDGNIVIDVGL